MSASTVIIRRRRGEGEATGLSEFIAAYPGEVSHGADIAMRSTGFGACSDLNAWVSELGGTASTVGSETTTSALMSAVATRYGQVFGLFGEASQEQQDDIEELFDAVSGSLKAHSTSLGA